MQPTPPATSGAGPPGADARNGTTIVIASVVAGLVILVVVAVLVFGGGGDRREQARPRPTLDLRSQVTQDRATGTTASGVPSTLEAGAEGIDGHTVTEIPFGLGTDQSLAELDELTADCSAGDLDSCDSLAEDAPEGTQYERFGRTCGGRRDPEPRSASCTEATDLTD